MHTIYRYRWAVVLLLAAFILPFTVFSQEISQSEVPEALLSALASSTPLSGSIQAVLDHDEVAGNWILHLNGSYTGDNSSITLLTIIGFDAHGTEIDRFSIDNDVGQALPTQSHFAQSFTILKPDPNWVEVAFGMTISDGTHSIETRSSRFPVIWNQPLLIDHAVSGTVIQAPNYVPGIIPPGIGISHTLINGLPRGDYYATVFFEGLGGCPSTNYEINSFRPGVEWYYDVRSPTPAYAKAYNSSGGGCMQEFHVDPAKNNEWLWGALSNTGTSSAIADMNSVPAFAICATAAACDPIIPHAATSVPEDPPTPPVRLTSNVLFLPGIKGSKLYENNPLCLLPSDSCGIPLWLPLADATVPELFLDTNGKSRHPVFARDGELLNGAFGHTFYDSFTRMLDDAKTNAIYGAGWNWKALAYDWRLSVPDIITNGAVHGSRIYYGESTDTPYLELELRKLASSSPTGKVTIVAHSNGGLVAKALMQSLGDTLPAQLIDSVIFVGVPQSGAPRALGALLYGDREGVPGLQNIPDFIMSAVHAREFGLNAPMAYHLLPSAAYFRAKQPSHPLVQFEDGTLLAHERATYGPTIDTEEELRSFALAEGSGRTQPDVNDLTSPNILNVGLLSYAQSEHAQLDPWQPPLGIETFQLGGYGVPTISGIDLYELTHKDRAATLSYRPLFTSEGDGTVPIQSSFLMNASTHVHQLWADLPALHTEKTPYSHGNMLESTDIQRTITNLISGSLVFPATVHAMDVASLPSPTKQLAFYIHSPVSITVIDTKGEISKVSKVETRDDIPGSVAGTFGETKYILVPARHAPYSVSLDGESSGEFTIDIQELNSDEVTVSSTIADVPVTNRSHATFSIDNSLQSVSPLMVDEDGNGTTDFSVTPELGRTVFPDIPNAVARLQTHAESHSHLPVSLSAGLQAQPEAFFASSTSSLSPVAAPASISPPSHMIPSSTTISTTTVITIEKHIADPIFEKHPTLFARVKSTLEKLGHAILHFLKMLVGRREW